MIHVGDRTKSLRDASLASIPLPFDRMFYPYGFPVQIKSNHPAVMKVAGQSWAAVQQSFQETPIELRISVSKHTNRRCPPAPVLHVQHHLLIMMANSKNFATCDLSGGFGSAWLTKTAANNSGYLRYHFVEAMAYTLLESLHLVTVRAACVAKSGQGVLLMEEPRPGKLSLASACARRGWTSISGEASCLVRRQTERVVIGNPPLPDPRSDAGTPFAEQQRALPDQRIAQISTVDYLVFAKRANVQTGSAHLLPVPRQEARRRLFSDICSFESPVHEEQSTTVERLLQAYVGEMSYSDVDAAIDLLEHLLRRGPVQR
jgi:hypothetical protein